MAKKTHKTAVVIIPPEACWPPIQSIRQKHDRQFRRWMPHITLIYPFRPRDEFDQVAEQFSPVSEKLKPFEVDLAEFHYFQHSQNNYTLWLSPEPKDMLVQLEIALWRMVPDCDEVRRFANGFTPHLSVGQALGKANMIRLRTALQDTWTPLKFKVSEVCLIWRNEPPQDVFRVGQKIFLRQK